MHGLLGYGGNYIINGNSSLGFYLSDNGYDVWLGNARGTRYSNKHTTLSNKSFDYWNFDWHEIAVKDLPASIDYILKNTGNKKISYVGHSQGTTVFFVMLAELPKYNKKISVMHALAPILSGKYIKSPGFRFMRDHHIEISKITFFTGLYSIELESVITRDFAKEFCVSKKQGENVCDTILRRATGLSRNQAV